MRSQNFSADGYNSMTKWIQDRKVKETKGGMPIFGNKLKHYECTKCYAQDRV